MRCSGSRSLCVCCAAVFSPSSCWHTSLQFIFYTWCWLRLEWGTRVLEWGHTDAWCSGRAWQVSVVWCAGLCKQEHTCEYRSSVWTNFAEKTTQVTIPVCRLVNPPFQSRLKHLNNYWMDCHKSLYRRSWLPVDESYWHWLAFPRAWGWHFCFLVKSFDNYWIDCHAIWCRYSWCPKDESWVLWWSFDYPIIAIIWVLSENSLIRRLIYWTQENVWNCSACAWRFDWLIPHQLCRQ